MSDENDLTSLRLRVEGFVQSVGYRNFIFEEATRLSLDGWVRNRADGTVEALLAGETAAIDAMIAACRRGSAYSIVSSVAEIPGRPTDPGAGFRVLPTER